MRDLLEKIDSISEYSIKKVGDTTEIDKDIDNAVAPRGISRDYTPQKLEQKLEWLIDDHAGFFKVVNDDYIKNRFYGRLAQTLKLRAFTAPDGTTVSTVLQKDGTFEEYKNGDLTSARKQNELGWLDEKIAKKYNLKWNDKFKEIEPKKDSKKEPGKDDTSSSPDYKNHGKQDFFSGGGQVKVKWNGTDVPQLSKDNWQDWIKLGNELLNRYVESVELAKSLTSTESIRLTLQQLFEQEEMSDQDKENWKVLLQQFSMFGKYLPPEAKSAFDNLQKRKTKYDLKFSVDDTMDIDSPADKNATTNLDWSDRKNFLPIIDKALQQYITTGNLERAFTPPYNAKDNPTLMSALGALRKNFNAQTGEDENGIISIYKHGGIEEVWPEIAKMMSDDSGDDSDTMVPDHNLVKWQGKNVQALDRYNAELWLKRANQLLAKYPKLFNTSKNESRINEEGFGDTLKGLWDKGVSAFSGDSKEQPEVQSKERLPNVEEIEPTFMRPEDQKEWVRLSDMFSQTALPDKFAKEWETINQKLVQSKKTATAIAGSKSYHELDPSSKKSTKMVQYQGKEVEELNRGNWKEWIDRAQRLLDKYAYTYGSRKKTESIHEELRYYMRLVENPKDDIDWSKIEPMSGADEKDWEQIKNMFSSMEATLPAEAVKAWKDLEFQKSKGDVDVKAKQRAYDDTDDPALTGSSGFDPGTKFSGTFKGNADDVERKGDLGYYADYINAVLSNPTADNLVTQANKVLGEVGFFDTRWNAMNNFYGIIAQELGLEGLISHVDTATNPPQVFYSRAKQTELSKKLGDKMPRGEFESDNVDFSDPKHRKIAQAQLNKNLLPASITYQQQKVNPQEEFDITKTADDSTKPMKNTDELNKMYGVTSDDASANQPPEQSSKGLTVDSILKMSPRDIRKLRVTKDNYTIIKDAIHYYLKKYPQSAKKIEAKKIIGKRLFEADIDVKELANDRARLEALASILNVYINGPEVDGLINFDKQFASKMVRDINGVFQSIEALQSGQTTAVSGQSDIPSADSRAAAEPVAKKPLPPTNRYHYTRFVPLPKSFLRDLRLPATNRDNKPIQYFVDRVPKKGDGLLGQQLVITDNDETGKGIEIIHKNYKGKAYVKILSWLEKENLPLISNDQADKFADFKADIAQLDQIAGDPIASGKLGYYTGPDKEGNYTVYDALGTKISVEKEKPNLPDRKTFNRSMLPDPEKDDAGPDSSGSGAEDKNQDIGHSYGPLDYQGQRPASDVGTGKTPGEAVYYEYIKSSGQMGKKVWVERDANDTVVNRGEEGKDYTGTLPTKEEYRNRQGAGNTNQGNGQAGGQGGRPAYYRGPLQGGSFEIYSADRKLIKTQRERPTNLPTENQYKATDRVVSAAGTTDHLQGGQGGGPAYYRGPLQGGRFEIRSADGTVIKTQRERPTNLPHENQYRNRQGAGNTNQGNTQADNNEIEKLRKFAGLSSNTTEPETQNKTEPETQNKTEPETQNTTDPKKEVPVRAGVSSNSSSRDFTTPSGSSLKTSWSVIKTNGEFYISNDKIQKGPFETYADAGAAADKENAKVAANLFKKDKTEFNQQSTIQGEMIYDPLQAKYVPATGKENAEAYGALSAKPKNSVFQPMKDAFYQVISSPDPDTQEPRWMVINVKETNPSLKNSGPVFLDKSQADNAAAEANSQLNDSTDFTRLLKNAGLLKEFY